jgi:gluconokinase
MLTAALQHHFKVTRKPLRLFIVMGVAGCGKSSIGEALAHATRENFMDGDHFHPKANIDKMSSGKPLSDDDRWPWLQIVAKEMAAREGIVFAGCSALKKTYRETLTETAREPVGFIFLDGSRELIGSRMAAREGHFMPTKLLDSQFATLERPDDSELVVRVDINAKREEVVKDILAQLSEIGVGVF